MKAFALATAAIASGLALGAAAQAPAERFTELDANRDHRLTLAEVVNEPRLVGAFRPADRDGDGALTPAEFRVAQDIVAPGAPRPAGPPPTAQLLGQLDADGDDRLSRWEAKERRWLLLRFDEFDRNDDGHIDRAELDRAPPESSASAGSSRPPAANADSAFRGLDRNRDGFLSKQELWSERGRRGDWVALDHDGDGRISRKEFSEVGR